MVRSSVDPLLFPFGSSPFAIVSELVRDPEYAYVHVCVCVAAASVRARRPRRGLLLLRYGCGLLLYWPPQLLLLCVAVANGDCFRTN